MTRQYTENQVKFLDVLFDEAGGDVATAKKLAGYADGTSTTVVVKSLKEEILDATQQYMARNAPKAAVAMASALIDPTELGLRDKMSAAKELLDRTGLIKTEKIQVEASGGVMLMPPKKQAEEDDPIFKQGWVLSSPNLSKPRPTRTERTEVADKNGTDNSTNADNTEGENNEIYINNSNRRQSDFQTRVRNIASKLWSGVRAIKSKILRK